MRICLENFSEQLTPVDDSFKIIVLCNEKFVNEIDLAFLNRLEKMKIQFEDLLETDEKRSISKIIENIKLNELNEKIEEEQVKFNYDLSNLLINCNKQDIEGLAYYLLLGTKQENIIKDKIYSKICNILPQDIAIILPDAIKKEYYKKKKYYNFKSYMKDMISGKKDLKNYKISIIYTFSNIANIIEGYNDIDNFMISEISTEGKLKTRLDDIKTKNKVKKNENLIVIRFEDFNSNKIKFVADYIKTYCKDDDYHYIFIIYLHRDFDADNNDSQIIIYSIPNIYENINQLFIDNLDAPEIKLEDLFSKNLEQIMLDLPIFPDIDKEFRETLSSFVYEKMPFLTETDEKKNIAII